MARPIKADDIALYMLKTAVGVRCVEFRLSDFPEMSLETLRTRLYVHKRGDERYTVFRVATGAGFITVVNIAGDEHNILVTEQDVRANMETIPFGRASKQATPEASFSWPIASTTPKILAAISVLIESGVINNFTITGCDTLIFNKQFPSSGFVVKDSPRGVTLF